jgi:hypothetical protein
MVLLLKEILFYRAQVVNEKHPVQVIDLMLYRPCELAFAFEFDCLTFQIDTVCKDLFALFMYS